MEFKSFCEKFARRFPEQEVYWDPLKIIEICIESGIPVTNVQLSVSEIKSVSNKLPPLSAP